MSKETGVRPWLIVGTSLLVVGAGVGWLVGLSVSPVVSIVIASVTGSVAAIVAAFSGLEVSKQQPVKPGESPSVRRWSLSPIPLAAFIVGVVLGSWAGIWARNNSLLGSEPSIVAAQWQQAGLSTTTWPREAIAQRIFESRYPAPGIVTGTTNTSLSAASTTGAAASALPLGTFLYLSISQDACSSLRGAIAMKEADAKTLRNELAALSDSRLAKLPDIVTDPAELKAYVEQVLCAE